MKADKATFSNQTHQLMVNVSRHFYLSKKGILTHQDKPFTVSLKNYRDSKKEHLVYYVVLDRFSGNFIFQVATTRRMLPLADFLYYAWRRNKDEMHMWGLPNSISIPKMVSSPALFKGLEKIGVEPFNPTKGFPSGGHVIKNLEENLWSQIIYRSTLHFKATIETHKTNIYELILGLAPHGDCRNIWRENLGSGHPKAVPSYQDFSAALSLADADLKLAESIPPAEKLPEYFTAPLQNAPFSQEKLEEAELINDEAWELGDSTEGYKIAYKALQHSPYCADALNYLSLYNGYYDEKHLLSSRAVMVGQAALGDLFIKKNAGHFWGMLETRPYMRALLGLADCYWEQRQFEQAVEIYRKMLHLNPNDNQGVRYALGYLLLLLDRRDELEEYFKEHGDEESCFMLYNKALYLYRIGSPEAETTLHKAIKANDYVYEYISGEQVIPFKVPDHYSLGEPSEAICYAAEAIEAWKETHGAIEWFEQTRQDYNNMVFAAADQVTIEKVLESFLAEQSKRLAKNTYNKYENVIELLEICIERYSCNYLNKKELALYEQHAGDYDEELIYCKLFGPDKIPSAAVEFLTFFIIHKVFASKDLLKTSATVVKKLAQWLFEKGYIDQSDYVQLTETAKKAGQELPAIEKFSEALYDYSVGSYYDFEDEEEESEELENIFDVVAVEPGKLYLENYCLDEPIEVKVPQKLSKLCRVGWQMELFLVKSKKGWIIAEAGRVCY